MDAQLLSSTAGDFTPVPRHLLHTPLTGGVLLGGAALDAGPSSNEKLQRGAGAILQSALVYSGWKFSKVVLTDSDERHLFDLEVKIKLGHDSSVQLLWDALSDFPAPVLMSRPGLMVAVLDLVGAVFTQDQLAANPGGLNPLTAMAWLEGLVRKSAAAFVTHLDGSLCSSVPESSQVLKPVDDEGAIDYGKPSLAAEMTRAMYSLRYPTLRAEGSEAESQAELNKSAAAAPLRVSPAPSLPGLSFASCAAALPLLQGRDPLIAARVLSLLQTALPYIREPAVAESASSSSAAAAAAASAELSLTDRKRIQHLLNRVEQLLRFFEARPLSVDRVLSLCLPLTDEEKLAAAPGEEQDKVLRVQDAAFESALLRAVVEVLVVVPVDSVRPMPEAASDADKADGSLLDVGPLTLDIAKDLVSSGGGSAQLLEVGEDSSVEATLTSLLRRADPVAMDGVTYASELLQSIAALQGMTELGESPNDHVPARFLLSKLLGKAHVVANLLDCGSDALLDEMTELGGSVPEIAVVLLAVAVSRCAEQNKDLVLRDADVCSAVSLLARLSCCCGAAIRVETYSCLLGVLTAGQSRGLSAEQVELLKALKFKAFPLHHLLAALASPNFVHSVVLFGLLGADSADIAYGQDNTQLVVSGSDPPVPEALLIVEHLLTFVLTSSGLDVAVAEAWSPLLGPLKVCEWGLSSSSEPALRLPQAVLSFITLLEDCCAASAGSSKARTAYGMALSLGLFHGVAAVRARCAVRLRYELVGLKAAAYEHEGGAALDPFADLGDEVSSLISWGALQTTGPAAPAPPAVSRIPSRLVNHSECRKLASIAFSGSHDAGIRASAVRQLVEMLADKHLIATAEAGWCVAVASGCSKALSAIPWGSSETLQAAPLADCKLALEAAALLRALVCESEAVRAAVVFWPQANSKGSGQEEDDDDHDAPSMDVSLWPLLSAALRVAPSAAQPGRPKPPQEGETALREAQALCVQVLAILSHDGGRWSDSLSPAPAYVALAHSGFVREYATVPAASSGGSGGSSGHEGATSVRVPTFLSSSFGYALPRVPGLSAGLAPQAIARLLAERGEDGRADVWPFQVSVMRCEMGDRSSGRARPLPSKRVMSLVARAAFAPSPQSLLSTVAAALCAAVATADSHKSLRALLHALGSLGAALPGLCGALVVEDLRLALSRLLSVPPRTKNDLVTLTAALSLLTQVTQACHGYHQAAVGSGQDSAWEVTQAASVLLDEVSSAVLAPLLPVLMDFKESTAGAATASLSPSFTSRDHVMKDKSVEESFARQQAHLAVLDLLDALSAVPYPLLSLAPSLADHALPHYLAQMVASELLPSSRRAKAASILESLVVRHGVRAALVCPLPNHLDAAAWDVLAVGPGKDAVSLDLVLKSIRLLRTPDSLRGNGSLLSSLRLFFCCLTQFSSDSGASDEEGRWWRRVRDWGWIMRLGWDRRSEVRLLTVSILQALLPVLPEVQGKSLAITIDSLEGHAADSPNRGLSGSSEWPPVESLTHVMLDCSEAHAVRAVALQSVVACSNGVPAEQLISAALDLIGAPSTQFSRMQSSASVSAPSSSAALSALYTVVTTYPAAEVAAAAKSLKMLPAIMSLVRNDVRSEMQQAALRRVGLLGPEDERATSLFPEGKRAGGAVRSSVRHFSLLGGWDACWLHFLRDKCEVSGSLAQAAACRVLSVLGSASVPANVPFLHAAKQTSLVRGLVSLLCSMDFLLQAPAKSGLTVAADHRTAAASDLLYALLSSEQGSEALSGLLQAEPFIAGLVVRRLTIRLEQLMLDAAGASALSSSAAASAASTLKALCALLDNSVFAALLADLDWPGMDEDGQPQRPSPVSECTGALLRLRVGVLDAEGATGLLGLRLDVAIGFWCQHFPSAQAALCQATQPGLSDVAFPLLDHYCEAVGEAAADLVAQQQAPTESALQAQQAADMKRSLRTLKKRTSAAQGPSINKPTVNPKWCVSPLFSLSLPLLLLPLLPFLLSHTHTPLTSLSSLSSLLSPLLCLCLCESAGATQRGATPCPPPPPPPPRPSPSRA